MPCPRCIHNPILVTDAGQTVALVSPLPDGIKDHILAPGSIAGAFMGALHRFEAPRICGACGMVFCPLRAAEKERA